MFTRHYKVLAYLLVNIKKQIRISKYSYRAKALVKYMFEEITDVFNQLWKQTDFDVLKFCHVASVKVLKISEICSLYL